MNDNKTVSDAPVRCAIYTRKSTDEGLEQEFNSLDAQREAAEAFIESQKREGWVCVPDRYDDGGFSGGTLERPALQRLLDDIGNGKVNCLVVYKVDRLSRSLLDFARIMETLDRHEVSFVSVTQQFNTTHSMGRLTLNILLSFAQFEREIIAERTRDKMSAARRKGKWTGGMPVLGYDIDPRGSRLLVNHEEAASVRAIFELYLEHQSLRSTAQELNRRGYVTKRWVTKKGRMRGGDPFDKIKLFGLLNNIIYLGKTHFNGVLYEGEHDVIVNQEVFNRVQQILRRNGRNGGKDVRNKYGALLKELLYCGSCACPMVHTYVVKKKRMRYRYYVCSHAQKNGWNTCPTKSVPADEIENFVVDRIRCVGKDPQLVSMVSEQIQQEHAKKKKTLENEGRLLQRRFKQHNEDICRLIEGTSDHGLHAAISEKLAGMQESIKDAEQRAIQIREELSTLDQSMVTEEEFTTLLSRFDPLWEVLSPREKIRVIRLIVDKVVYDGHKQSITLAFRSNGIKTLLKEINSGNATQG